MTIAMRILKVPRVRKLDLLDTAEQEIRKNYLLISPWILLQKKNVTVKTIQLWTQAQKKMLLMP